MKVLTYEEYCESRKAEDNAQRTQTDNHAWLTSLRSESSDDWTNDLELWRER